ncbi:PilN domain-containing protein [Pseudaestuariivita rosea]|uniref:PilN domain-containing protein n=1 Tax=Pseudaestuariivita rosea TaxID=2763263 RepID=UPI001ABA1E1E|nr:PilN domain-containing protein [Pseudaestuariivita rosea]
MAAQAPSQLWQWFCQELSSMVPAWLKTVLTGGPHVLTLHLSQTATALKKTRSGYLAPETLLTDATETNAGPLTVDLYLPEHHFLKREIEAPAPAFKNMAQLVRLDMMRRTPFQPNDVHWTVSEPVAQGPKARATQWLIKRSDAEQLRAHLKTIGVHAQSIRVDTDLAKTPVARFQTQTNGGWQKWLNLGLAAAVVMAFAVVLIFPAFQDQRNLNQVENQIADLRRQAIGLRGDLEALRQAEQDRTALVDTVINKTVFAETLREMTIALPDDVWISDLSFQPNRIVVNGNSDSSAAELVLRVANNRLFENPRLTGPVSRTTSGQERFEMTLDLRPSR